MLEYRDEVFYCAHLPARTGVPGLCTRVVLFVAVSGFHRLARGGFFLFHHACSISTRGRGVGPCFTDVLGRVTALAGESGGLQLRPLHGGQPRVLSTLGALFGR